MAMAFQRPPFPFSPGGHPHGGGSAARLRQRLPQRGGAGGGHRLHLQGGGRCEEIPGGSRCLRRGQPRGSCPCCGWRWRGQEGGEEGRGGRGRGGGHGVRSLRLSSQASGKQMKCSERDVVEQNTKISLQGVVEGLELLQHRRVATGYVEAPRLPQSAALWLIEHLNKAAALAAFRWGNVKRHGKSWLIFDS
eukprot:s1797_g14.t1